MKTKITAKKKSPHAHNVRRERSKNKGPRATVTTIHHAKGRHPLAGSEERGIVLRHRALQLKMRGLTLAEIARQLEQEYELTKTPPIGTVYDWIQTALRDGMSENEKLVAQHVALFIARAEEVIRGLMPFAAGEFVVERTRMIDGCEVKVIDERVLDERVKAASEVRKQGESVLRAMGVNRAGPAREDADSDDLKQFVLTTVEQHIAKPGQVLTAEQAKTILELTSGDPIIDSLGAP